MGGHHSISCTQLPKHTEHVIHCLVVESVSCVSQSERVTLDSYTPVMNFLDFCLCGVISI